MHEIGTLYKVVQTAEAFAEENHAIQVLSITLDVGELSGMLPYFFESYYPIVIENHPLLHGSKLVLQTTPGIGHCNDCGENYNVAKNEGACPHCGSRDKRILTGRSLFIKDICIAMEEAS
ncbi:MAG: hydrogenase maturation nickel metallochaperone HypA [Clostridia bacterium]|nr:hydrogenase maturation nickel metallochaperone HypA [Clostridia bacterium]